MEKRLLLLISTVLAMLLVVPSWSVSNLTRPTQSAQESDLFFDDFESYESGSFPSRGGWQLADPGIENIIQNHMVTNLEAYSGSRSLMLNKKAFAMKTFSAQASSIGYEVAINLTGGGGAAVGFGSSKQPLNKMWATVSFMGPAWGITSEDVARRKLGDWEPAVWYILKVILNRASNTYDVWINGALKGEKLKVSAEDTGLIDALDLTSADKVYYDDVRAFTVSVSTVGPTATSTITIPTTRTVTSMQPTVSPPPTGPDLTPIALTVLSICAISGLAMYALSIRRRRQVSAAEVGHNGTFEVSVSAPSVGKTVTLEVAPDHAAGSLVETLISTLGLPKGKAYAIEYEGKVISQIEFGKTLASFGIKEGSKLSLRVVE
jgi:hypothetical protein